MELDRKQRRLQYPMVEHLFRPKMVEKVSTHGEIFYGLARGIGGEESGSNRYAWRKNGCVGGVGATD